MKILQLNIWGGKLGKQIIELLQRESADVVCLQEAIELPGGHTFLLEDIDEIKTKTDYKYCYFSPQWGFSFMNRQAKFGLAILSKIPFSETNHIFTRLEYIDHYDFLDNDYNIRGLQHIVVEHSGQLLHILNHHGHHISSHKEGDEETMRQCQMIVEYMEKLEGEKILCGDFNLAPDSQSLLQFSGLLVNHAKEYGIVTTRTPLTHKTEVCDYIFTSPGLDVQNFQVLDDIVSDHKALTIEIN